MGEVPLPTRSSEWSKSGVAAVSPINKPTDMQAFLESLLPSGFDLTGDEGTLSSDWAVVCSAEVRRQFQLFRRKCYCGRLHV